MRSATLLEPRRFTVDPMETPVPGEGEVLLKVRGCGVCGSDMGPWKGIQGLEYPMKPGAPGHEVFGIVEALGPGVEGLKAGDPVTALTYRAYSEYDIARAADIVPLPVALAGKVVLGEPVACAVNVSHRTGVKDGDVVVLLGTGFLGALMLQLLNLPGAPAPSRVITVSRRKLSEEMADRLRRRRVADLRRRRPQLGGRGDQRGDGRRGDRGDRQAAPARPRRRADPGARPADRRRLSPGRPAIVNMQLWNWRGIDVVNAHERDPEIYKRGMEEGVRLLAEGGLDLEPLITHTFPLAEINRAFATSEERPEGFLKSVVMPEAGA